MSRKPQQMELFPASQIAERLGNNDRLMEMILERNNITRAWKQICANKGVPGVDAVYEARTYGSVRGMRSD